ncbi:MAG TPA: helix-turn-helix transcriptional regulator [Candidatus Sulfotelmatobacter sp.]|nr:helix-turn-helix transcriptional regulator [Candidatus Sulfotelmatobacter sp.]
MDSSKFREDIGEKIKSIRKKANLTQAEVAKKAGLNVNYFAVIERGEVTTSSEKLKKISDALKVDISQITG